eukprot:2151111-Lingulodinium_polyedra.AAC.1
MSSAGRIAASTASGFACYLRHCFAAQRARAAPGAALDSRSTRLFPLPLPPPPPRPAWTAGSPAGGRRAARRRSAR